MIETKFKLVIFDLDGVLLDSKDLHFQALNRALRISNFGAEVSTETHLVALDGLPTLRKLEVFAQLFPDANLDVGKTYLEKQRITHQLLEKLGPDPELIEILAHLKSEDIKVAVATNSIRKTLDLVLDRLGIVQYIDFSLSNEDVVNSKPHPEIYWLCMAHFGAVPAETAIFEDSKVGKQAALQSGAKLVSVTSRMDLSLQMVNEALLNSDKPSQKIPWTSSNLNVLIPMAGKGSRFQEAGFTFPKPLIEVMGKPMIQRVVENLNIDANYIFLAQKEHYEKYNLKFLLNLISPGCKIVVVDGPTEGAASTALLAHEYIDNDTPLLIANSDQIIEWDSSEVMYALQEGVHDGAILTFRSTHPKWSFVKLDEHGYISEVAEKKPISDIATTGIYFWKHGKDFVKSVNQMIDKQDRVNGEFYIAPAFNYAISGGQKFVPRFISKMWGIGTPEDLNSYLMGVQKLN